MSGWTADEQNRRGLLMMAAAAGATLAMHLYALASV